ncbi:MAG: hypothetical protein ACETWR_17460, partial [Anaerolineae bacterium]
YFTMQVIFLSTMPLPGDCAAGRGAWQVSLRFPSPCSQCGVLAHRPHFWEGKKGLRMGDDVGLPEALALALAQG